MNATVKIHRLGEFQAFPNSEDGSGFAKSVIDGARFPVSVLMTIEEYEALPNTFTANVQVWAKGYEKDGKVKGALSVRFLSVAY